MLEQKYCKVGDRPVKGIRNNKGFGIYVFNWESGSFDLNQDYLEKIYFGSMDDIEELTKQEFESYVEELRAKIKEKNSEE